MHSIKIERRISNYIIGNKYAFSSFTKNKYINYKSIAIKYSNYENNLINKNNSREQNNNLSYSQHVSKPQECPRYLSDKFSG